MTDSRIQSQISSFYTDGYVLFPGLLPPELVAKLASEIDDELSRARAMSIKKSHNQWVPMLSSRTPYARDLFEENVILEIVRAVCGDDFFGVMSDAYHSLGSTFPHADADTSEFVGVRANYYVSSLNQASGALRMAPGSHLSPLNMRRVESVDCILDVNAGDVILFDLRLWHAVSCQAEISRRFGSLFYYSVPRSNPQIEIVRSYALRNLRAPAAFGRPTEPLYPEDWVKTESAGDTRKQWIGRLREFGFISD